MQLASLEKTASKRGCRPCCPVWKRDTLVPHSVYLLRQHLPLIAIANNAGSLPLLICAILITLLAFITGISVLMGPSVAGAKHGDAILIDEVVRREEAAEAE